MSHVDVMCKTESARFVSISIPIRKSYFSCYIACLAELAIAQKEAVKGFEAGGSI